MTRRSFRKKMNAILPPLVAFFCLFSVGCERPCKQLADELCRQTGSDDRACEEWKDRTSRVPSHTCEVGLRAINQGRTR